MASAVSPLANSGADPTTSSNSQNSLTSPNESVFLNLLVAQIQNQDPLNPADSTQFVSQLAQFSELEQVIGIHNDTDSMLASMQGTAANGTTQTSSTDQTNGTSQS